MNDAIVLGTPATIGWVVAGILFSLILPIAVRTLKNAGLESLGAKPTLGQRVREAWIRYGGNRYLGIAAAALVVGVILVYLLGLEFHTARDATLAGFAWESLVNKLVGGSGSQS